MQKNRPDPNKVYINEEIRSLEVRAMGPEGENYGVMKTRDAVAKAQEMGLDLIEVSARAVPPVAKIMDYGKFSYEQKKKAKEMKAKAHTTETKNVQVKIGTGERDKELKAKRIVEWLLEGHRVKVDLFLWGRYKFMEAAFLTERLQRFLKMVPVPYKIADPMKRSPKGYTCTIEVDKSKPIPEDINIITKKKKEKQQNDSKETEAKKNEEDDTIEETNKK